MGRGFAAPFEEPHPRFRPFGPRFYGSQGLTHYRVDNPTNDRFQTWAYMKFVFFSVKENGENGLGEQGADGGNAPLRMFGLEPPLGQTLLAFCSCTLTYAVMSSMRVYCICLHPAEKFCFPQCRC